MKKRTILFLLLAISMMGVGAVGSIYYYQQAHKAMRTSVSKEYTMKQQEHLDLYLAGNARYSVQTTSGNQVKLNSDTYTTSKVSVDWQGQKNDTGEEVTVKADWQRNNQPFLILANMDYHSDITISIPDTVKNVTLHLGNGQYTYIGDMKTSNLAIKADKNAHFSLGNINSETIDVTSQDGSVIAYGDVAAKEMTITSAAGTVDLSDLAVQQLTVTSTSGSVNLNDLRGSINVQTESGDISLNDGRGTVTLNSRSGNISLNGDDFPEKLQATTDNGDITGYLEDVQNISIKAAAEVGDVSLFQEDRTSYTNGSAKHQMELQTKLGDIQLDGYTED